MQVVAGVSAANELRSRHGNTGPQGRSAYWRVTGESHGDGPAGPDLKAAQMVAAECVTLAETKDHLNWELIGELAKNSTGEAKALKEAHDQVEPEEDEHLYHTQGWTRELWIETLGMPAVLPPPEEDEGR